MFCFGFSSSQCREAHCFLHRDFSRKIPTRQFIFRPHSESVVSACLTQGPRTRASVVGNVTDRMRTARGTSNAAGHSVRGPCGILVAPRGVFTPGFTQSAAAQPGSLPTARSTTGHTTVRRETLPRTAEGKDLEMVETEMVCTSFCLLLRIENVETMCDFGEYIVNTPGKTSDLTSPPLLWRQRRKRH